MATPAQRVVRQAFKKSCNCFHNQPQTGGVTPPTIGPRSREWWFDNAGGMWYYNHFIQASLPIFLSGQIPDWCRSGPLTISPIFSVTANDKWPGDQANFSYTGCFINPPDQTYNATRMFWSIDISPITKEDAENGGPMQVILAYKNSYHPLSQGFPPGISHPVYHVPSSGQLTPTNWDGQPGMGSQLGTMELVLSNDSTPFACSFELGTKYKELVFDEEQFLNIGFMSPYEYQGSYPWSAITFFKTQSYGEGFAPQVYISFY